MARKKIQKAAPANYWVPENIPKQPKLRCIIANPPWIANQRGRYGATSNTIRSRHEQEGKLR